MTILFLAGLNIQDISTHIPREGNDYICIAFGKSVYVISTHIPREGNDDTTLGTLTVDSAISTHIPREGNDKLATELTASGVGFQPTSPARGMTWNRKQYAAG